MKPRAPARSDHVADVVAGSKRAEEDVRVLVDRDRSLAPVARRDEPQFPETLGRGERLLLVPGRNAATLGRDPDLEEVDAVRAARVELAVLDAGPGRHPLDVAGSDHRARAHAVLVLE